MNLAGIDDPAVDTLIDKALKAQSRAELVVICRALDRVLRSGHYWIPIGSRPTGASPPGTCSAGPRRSRSSTSASRPCGGGTRKKRPR